MKKYVLGLLTGLLLTGTIVFATYKYKAEEIGYTPSNENFKVDNVESAINELYNNKNYYVGEAIYYNPVSNSKCTKVEADSNVNDSGTSTEIKTGCMKWYVINDNNDKVTMILDHNTTARIKWDDNNENVSYENSNLKTETDKLVSESGWKVTPRLITAAEVAGIVGGVESWKMSDPNTWFYFEGTETDKQTKPVYSTTNRSKYAWLYDNLIGCREWGCNIEDNREDYAGIGIAATGNTMFYWTSTPIDIIDKVGQRIWRVNNGGSLRDGYGHFDCGIRPVITISKSIIK